MRRVLILCCLLAACADVPTDLPVAADTTHTPSAATGDTTALLGIGRIARLPSDQRAAWTAYVSASTQGAADEKGSMDAELKAAGLASTTAAPRTDADFAVTGAMTDAWFRGDAGRAMTSAIISYQTRLGGWGKHVDFTQGTRAPGQNFNGDANTWEYVGTIDNDATVGEMQFVARAYVAAGDTVARFAFLRGLAYLAQAQMPNGCWPQVWPLQGGYHDAVTFNDDAITHVLTLLRDVAGVSGTTSSTYAWLTPELKDRAGGMLARGLACVTAAQVVAEGVRTAWGQQHDPLTLQPTLGRSYELPGVSGSESAVLMRFLMTLATPDAATVGAVHAAADWFTHTQLFGLVYDASAGTLTTKSGAGPLWARIAEMGTNRPIYANRDGIKLYDFNLLTDRRTGYTWLGTWPASALSTYATWSRSHPR